MWKKPSAPSQLKDASVRALKCDEGRMRQEVSVGQGLIIDVRSHADGTYAKTWLYRFKTKSGKRRRMTIGQYPTVPVKEALRRHNELRLQIQSGRDPWLEERQERESARQMLSGTELVERYLREWAFFEERPGVPRKRSAYQDKRILERDFLPRYGSRPVNELTRTDMEDILRDYKSRAPRSHDQVRSILSGMFNWAIREGLYADNPCENIRKVQSSKTYAPERFLDEDELHELFRRFAAEEKQTALRDALLFQLHTGARIGEVTRMRWSDLSNGVWTIPVEHSKNKRAHLLPLAGCCCADHPRPAACRTVALGVPRSWPERACGASYSCEIRPQAER